LNVLQPSIPSEPGNYSWLRRLASNGNKFIANAVYILGRVRRKAKLPEQSKLAYFEQTVLSNLDAAYNLARWLTRDDRDAEDVVQDACLRAFRFFDSFHGGDSRAWLLTIVRHTCYTWLKKNRAHELVPLDEELDGVETGLNPEELLLLNADQQLLRQAVEELPIEFREVIILRELEGLSYKEIASVTGVPLGTVMSRLARARKRLQHGLTSPAEQEG
jgi:RNA polymerase sigma-70 factor (ECF subfamily)